MSDALDTALEEIKAGKAKPLYLVHGEEFLARRAAEAICDALVPPKNRDLNFSQVDGSVGGREVAQHLDTIPMFRGTKVVFVDGADALLAKRDTAKEITRAKELWQQSTKKKDAARRLLALISHAGWTFRDLDPDGPGAHAATKWKKEVGFAPEAEDRPFFAEVAKYAADLELKAPKDDAEALHKAVTAGPPKGNHLVVLCEEYDAKHPVAKAIAEKGLILERGVEKSGKGRGIEALDITSLVDEVLTPLGKKMTPDAVRLLKDRLGEAMRQTASELEKLAIYVGAREKIEARDVDVLVSPLREEDFWELGNALGDGDVSHAMKLVNDELGRGKHGLMIMGAVNGAVRRMALDAARFAKIPGSLGGREQDYRAFQSGLLDQYVAQCVGERAPNPYVAWLGYKRVRRHGVIRLLKALALCAEVDLQLKRGADAQLSIERVILALCGTPPR